MRYPRLDETDLNAVLNAAKAFSHQKVPNASIAGVGMNRQAAELRNQVPGGMCFTSGASSQKLLPFMKLRRRGWFLALLAMAGALALSSCMSQEGIAPAEDELHRPASMGGD